MGSGRSDAGGSASRRAAVGRGGPARGAEVSGGGAGGEAVWAGPGKQSGTKAFCRQARECSVKYLDATPLRYLSQAALFQIMMGKRPCVEHRQENELEKS